MSNIFNDISLRKPKKSIFNLSHQRKFSFRPGFLYPTMCQEVLPGDLWNHSSSALVRFQPLLSPLMHIVDVCVYNFFVPNRLAMERSKWEVFITGGANGDGKDPLGNTIETPYVIMYGTKSGGSPVANSFGADEVFTTGTIGDYLGCNTFSGTSSGMDNVTQNKFNVMPFLHFWRIWCEYFRDQNVHKDYVNLYPGIFSATGNIGAAIVASEATAGENWFWNLPKVCWEKDMFTSALPFAQRGAPVQTPLSGTGSVTYRHPAIVRTNSDAVSNLNGLLGTSLNSTPQGRLEVDKAGQVSAGSQGYLDNIQSVSLTSGGFTINDLRLAARLQEYLERMARGGARYKEQLLSIWGVNSSDARLQRSEYLSGGKIPVHISEVLQTSATDEAAGTTPQGEMAGHAAAAGNASHYKKYFEEHGFVMSFIFLRPKTAYQQGMPRWATQRPTRLDYAIPQFAQLGEQEVKVGELYWKGSAAADGATFGYQQRYAEYKYIPSTVHGDFKLSLDFWHWGRQLDGWGTGSYVAPTLSPTFVECSPDERVFNVVQSGVDNLYAIVNHNINAVRPLPYYGEPTL